MLNPKQQERCDVIKASSTGALTKSLASAQLGISSRQIERLVIQYKEKGEQAFIHGNKSRVRGTTISEREKNNIADIYTNKYCDMEFSRAYGLMVKNDNISISETSFRKIMHEKSIFPPRTRRRDAVSKANIIKNAVKNAIKGKFNSQDCFVFVMPCPTGADYST